MPIQLTTPPKDPVTGETMPVAMANHIRIDVIGKVITYEMWFGKLTAEGFLPMVNTGRAVHRNIPERTEYGHDVTTGEYGPVTVPAQNDFDAIVAMAVHVVAAGEEGNVITAYDLISENAIYSHEMATRPELFAGTVL